MALRSSKDPGVKVVAQMIIADHKKAGEKLENLNAVKDDGSPSAALSPKHQKMLEQLKAAKGKDFDSLYADIQEQAHMEAVALFATYAGSGEDQKLVGFAKETLPALETHVGHVKMLIAEQ